MMISVMSGSFLSILPTSVAMMDVFGRRVDGPKGLSVRPGVPAAEQTLPPTDNALGFDPQLYEPIQIQLDVMSTSRELARAARRNPRYNDPNLSYQDYLDLQEMKNLEASEGQQGNKGGIIRMVVKRNNQEVAYATRWNDFAHKFLPDLLSALGNGDVDLAIQLHNLFPAVDRFWCTVNSKSIQARTVALQSWLNQILNLKVGNNFDLNTNESIDILHSNTKMNIKRTFDQFCESLPQVSAAPTKA